MDSGSGSRLKGNAGMTYCRDDGFKILGDLLMSGSRPASVSKSLGGLRFAYARHPAYGSFHGFRVSHEDMSNCYEKAAHKFRQFCLSSGFCGELFLIFFYDSDVLVDQMF
jgi:hypothetical protein